MKQVKKRETLSSLKRKTGTFKEKIVYNEVCDAEFTTDIPGLLIKIQKPYLRNKNMKKNINVVWVIRKTKFDKTSVVESRVKHMENDAEIKKILTSRSVIKLFPNSKNTVGTEHMSFMELQKPDSSLKCVVKAADVSGNKCGRAIIDIA